MLDAEIDLCEPCRFIGWVPCAWCGGALVRADRRGHPLHQTCADDILTAVLEHEDSAS